MYCNRCKSPIDHNSTYCKYCGKKQKIAMKNITISIALLFTTILGIYYFNPFTGDNNINRTVTSHKLEEVQDNSETIATKPGPKKILENDRVALIEQIQETVYTIFTGTAQGSAFLYDDRGHVITNAHVVEGSLTATIKTNKQQEYTGRVIGYSNEIDVALLHIPELIGTKPFPLEKQEKSKVGQEVVALGTPLGYENTATMGYITGVDRNFVIPPHAFNDVYQISAPIEPGNSGGPLLALESNKIIAMNAAKSNEASNIAFSIPLHQFVSLIDSWINNPMTEEAITALFFDESGNYYYDYLWTLLEEYYFEGGDYTEEDEYYYYWYYDDNNYLDDYDEDDFYWEEEYDFDHNDDYDFDEYDNYDEWESDNYYDWDNDDDHDFEEYYDYEEEEWWYDEWDELDDYEEFE